MSETPTVSADDAKRTARNVGVLVIAQIVTNGVQFIWQIWLAALLGAFDYGVFNTVMALFAIGTSVANFGIGLIAIREIASNPEKIGQYAGSMLYTQTVLALVGYVSIVFAASVTPNFSQIIVAYTAIAGISIIIDMWAGIANDLFIAQERMVTSSIMSIVPMLLRVVLSAWVLLVGWGLLGLYLVTIATGILRAVVLWGIHWRSGLQVDWRIKRTITIPLLINAAPLATNGFLALLYNHADKLMTTSIIGEESTGFLGPAFLINFGVTELLSTAVLVAMYPMMARYYDNNSTDTFGYIVETLARFMLMIALPIALTVSIFADDIILLIYPIEYTPTIGILRILIWYTMVVMVTNVFNQALIVQNRQRLTLLIRIGALTLNITLNAILLLRYRDPRGAAIASLIAEILTVWLMSRAFSAAGFNWAKTAPNLARVLAFGVLTAGVMLALGNINVILGGAVGLMLYTVSILRGGVLNNADWDLLYRLLAAMPGGSLIRRYWQRDVTLNW